MNSIEEINEAINNLSVLLDSDAYMKMINAPATSANDEIYLQGAFLARNRLIQALLAIYAKRIDDNSAAFEEITEEMKSVNKEAKNAASTLKTYAERLESAVKVAGYVDKALQLAAGLAK